jgi:hypothetical protein
VQADGVEARIVHGFPPPVEDELGLIPDSVKTVAEFDTSDDERKAENFKILMNSIQRRLMITLEGTATGLGAGMADGGAVYGVGGPRQDNILTRLSVGEHVFDAEDVKRMGGQDNVYKFRAALYHTRGMADGGAVGVYGGAYGYPSQPQYASNNTYNTVNSGPSEVVLNGATLIVKDVNNQIIGRMQVEADQRIQVADNSSARTMRRGKQI